MRTTTVDLRAEGIAEAARLTAARALLRDGDERALFELEGDATWIARPRRTSLKRSLAGRACLVWRVAFEEPSGRLAESKLVPVLADVPRSADRHAAAWVERFLQQAEGLVRARVEAECEAWRAEVTNCAGAFSSSRMRREREIAGRSERHRRESQPGLFDRRAERSRDAEMSATAESRRITAARRQEIGAVAQIAPRPARLLLVLVP
jgi:hypothetical protein